MEGEGHMPTPERVNAFFDAIELITKRLPVLHHFIVEVVLIGLAVIGAISLLVRHP